eukprot:4241190-Amphidinium_carterae.1
MAVLQGIPLGSKPSLALAAVNERNERSSSSAGSGRCKSHSYPTLFNHRPVESIFECLGDLKPLSSLYQASIKPTSIEPPIKPQLSLC